MKKSIFTFVLTIQFISICLSQNEAQVIPYSGIFVAGYVDHGAYLNFTGPALSYSFNKSQFLIGMLPSLRIKKDSGLTKNSIVTPSLGIGITYCYKSLVFQMPMYYNTKTSSVNGKWNVGIGIGLKIRNLKIKKE